MKLLLPLLCIAPILLAGCARAQGPITPENFDQAWRRADCGQTLVLSPGEYGSRNLGHKACGDRPITIEAKGATLVDWRIRNVAGLNLRGATLKNQLMGERWSAAITFQGARNADGSPSGDCARITISGVKAVGPYSDDPASSHPGKGYGVNFLRCQDVAVTDSALQGFGNALLFGISSRVRVENVDCAFMSSDCIDLGQVWGATVTGVTCRATYITGKEHPDCIQVWSRYFYPNSSTPAPPSSDLTIRNNRVDGKMQGIFLGNHERQYQDGQVHNDGGFERVVIEDNVIRMGGGNAIGVHDTKGLKLRNNRVSTLPDAPYIASINESRNTDMIRCGNVVASGGGNKGYSDKPCAGGAGE